MSLNGFLKKFIKFFPIPKSLSLDFVGVDMCRSTLRVMQFEDSKFGKIPKRFKEYNLNQVCGLFEVNPEYKNCEELIGVLKQIKNDFGVKYVNVSIPEVRNYIYKTKIPTNVGKDLGKALIFSVEENVPIKPEDALIDYFVIKMDENDIEAIVTVINKDIIEKYTQIFELAGLIPISFEPETHATARAIVKNVDDQFVLVNLDQYVSSLAIIKNEVVQYAQILPLKGKNFAEGFDEEEARILKENINKVIIYWSTSLTEKDLQKINTIFLVGKNAYSNELINYLEKHLPLNVKFANVWSNAFDLDDYIPNIHLKDSLKYATSIGLALKKLR